MRILSPMKNSQKHMAFNTSLINDRRFKFKNFRRWKFTFYKEKIEILTIFFVRLNSHFLEDRKSKKA
jgi:hypothetical protein